ncbi:hypothetical protein [Leeuwenhoekiella nanhaiensis]|uniref:hypothetical protein n=1 Tax=Leeuwenhoekiella nanhaiensis TaxID=1655491 RepID=UPI0016717F1A|nr:hypothetical protein [Leeuwenhoekiella nanhaiensis]
MKRVSSKSTITLQEVEDHYQSSRENYDIESAESHLAYYRERHPEYYALLLQNV